VVETRRILEAGIAPLAAQRATERDFWNIEDALSLIEKAVRRKESVAEIGPAFHNAVAEATHNTILAKLLRSFNILMARAGKLLEAEALDAEEFKLLELESHRKLYNVIRTRDPIAARETFIQHISNSEDLIIKAFRRAEADQHDEDAKKSERPRVRR
jgi:GntR family transcriptional repressor for pyruvate dehydrogenase complex